MAKTFFLSKIQSNLASVAVFFKFIKKKIENKNDASKNKKKQTDRIRFGEIE